MLELMKNAFTDPKEIREAKKLPKGKAFLYLLVLSLIMALPLVVEGQRALRTIQEDGREVAQSIPDFTVQNGEVVLEQDTDSFVYQTDTFLFFFDAEGQMTTETISQNLERLGVPFGIGVMENEMYVSVLTYDASLPYSQLEGLTGAALRDLMGNVGTYNFFYGAVFFFVFLVASLINLAFELLIYTLFANILASFMRKRYRFGENWKLVTVAATVPIVLFSLLNLFGIYFIWQMELTGLITLLFYYRAVKNDSTKPAQ